MYILISNDDGIQSTGLLTLKQALAPLGEIAIVAPDRNWSAGSHSITMYTPIRIEAVTLADGSPALACNGTPADCVRFALLGVLDRRPDLVVSGINHGANLSHDVIYSGTVAAAMEAVIKGIPSMAVSLSQGKETNADFSVAGYWAKKIISLVFEHGINTNGMLNVNVPKGSLEQVNSMKMTRLGQRTYHDQLDKRYDPYGRAYYWLTGDQPSDQDDPDTDLGAVRAGFVSVTPLQFDLTNNGWLDQLRLLEIG